jgi:hypothetical protein
MRRFLSLPLAAAAFALTFGQGSSASAGFILGLDGEGNIYQIDTSNAVATQIKNYADVGGDFSPNALAYDGSTYYYTSFGQDPTKWYKNGAVVIDSVTTNPLELPGPSSTGEVASGATYNGQYFYGNSDGSLYKIPTTSTDASDAVQIRGPQTPPPNTYEYGDLVFSPSGELFVSYNGVGLEKLNPADGTSDGVIGGQEAPNGSGKWAGLGFDLMNGMLYGVAGDGVGGSELYKLDPTGGAKAVVGGITYNNESLFLTDAATAVPIPGAVWLFGSGVLGLLGVGYSRKRKAAA